MTLYPSSIGLDPIFCETNANAHFEFNWEQNRHLQYILVLEGLYEINVYPYALFP